MRHHWFLSRSKAVLYPVYKFGYRFRYGYNTMPQITIITTAKNHSQSLSGTFPHTAYITHVTVSITEQVKTNVLTPSDRRCLEFNLDLLRASQNRSGQDSRTINSVALEMCAKL